MSNGNRSFSWKDRFEAFRPVLQKNENLELQQRLELAATADADYVIMMVLSSALASLGLLQSSSAVVIGAMLVAPLMGPLVSAGLAVVQGNGNLLRRSLRSSLIGIVLGFLISLLAGFLNPGFEPSLEVEARGRPDLMDLAIAFASGMAAAYAMGRPNVAITLAGVAIAAALVPPLIVIGIALVGGHYLISANATLLLVTNLVAIILGASTIFRFLGVHEIEEKSSTPPWVRKVILWLISIAMVLSIPLIKFSIELSRTGQDRPLTYPVSITVRQAVYEYLEDWPHVRLLLLARKSMEPDEGIVVMMTSPSDLPTKFRDELTKVIQDSRGIPVTVTFHLLQSATFKEESPAVTPRRSIE